MRAFQSTYVGRRDFPKSLPDFMLRRWFTLEARDRRLIRKTIRSRYWINAALQLGFVGITGTTLRSMEYVPTAVLRHLGRQFAQAVPRFRNAANAVPAAYDPFSAPALGRAAMGIARV